MELFVLKLWVVLVSIAIPLGFLFQIFFECGRQIDTRLIRDTNQHKHHIRQFI